ncbi:MAG: NAD-dependent dehydratase [Chloroflexi bacterium]|nr:NAD-dependent dehydratase [Chloroflexota bacterium]
MSFKDKRVLVTGGAGFIGSEVILQLLQKKALVTVLDNFSSGKRKYLPKSKQLKIIKGDIRDEKITAKAVKDQEVIINLAALPFIPDSFFHPSDFFSVNTMGSVNVLWKAINAKTPELFIHISTSEVYGSAQKIPMDENHPTAPHSTYAVSKLAADRSAFTLYKENGFPTVVIRPFNSYGPRFTEPYIIPEIMNQLLTGTKELTLGNVNTSRDFTFVQDTADGILRCIDNKKAIGEIINIGSGTEISILDLAKKILKISRKKISIKYDESRERPYDVNRLICDNKKAHKLLKWKPKVSMTDGLTRSYEWARKNKIIFNAPFSRWYYKKN